MKTRKLLGILLAAVICVGALAGCGSSKSEETTVSMKDGYTVETVVKSIVDEVGIAMPAEIDDTILKDMCHVDPANVESYYGQIAMVNVSADNIIGVQAKPGKGAEVAEGLNQRLEDVKAQFAQYLPDQKEKTEKGKVIEKGDYVFLLILGSDVEKFDEEMQRAEELVNEAF